MKWLLGLGLLFGVISVILGALSLGTYIDPKYPGKCVIKPNIILSAGQNYTYPDVCQMISCQEESKAFIATCPFTATPPGCTKVDADPRLGFPACCTPKMIC